MTSVVGTFEYIRLWDFYLILFCWVRQYFKNDIFQGRKGAVQMCVRKKLQSPSDLLQYRCLFCFLPFNSVKGNYFYFILHFFVRLQWRSFHCITSASVYIDQLAIKMEFTMLVCRLWWCTWSITVKFITNQKICPLKILKCFHLNNPTNLIKKQCMICSKTLLSFIPVLAI